MGQSSDHLRSLKHIFLLPVVCLPTGPDVQRFHPSRRCAFSLSFPYPPSIIQSMSFCLSLPIPLFPSILPSITSLCRELPPRMCPIQYRNKIPRKILHSLRFKRKKLAAEISVQGAPLI